MLHKSRTWTVQTIGSASLLAYKLSHVTWVGCQAFELDGLIFANDSESTAGSQLWGVLTPEPNHGGFIQVDCINFSWCTEDRALELIEYVRNLSPRVHRLDVVSRDRIIRDSEHHLCEHCS
jgi:hypothetical protein